jgi:hypothetical protein
MLNISIILITILWSRDMVRCKALTSLGWDVYTLDNKHSPVMLF